MTRKEELEQKANKAVDLVYGRVDRNADLDEYDRRECVANICAMFLQVEREALGRMRKAVVQKQSSIHPEHTLEFKSGAGNVLYDLEQWLDAQQPEPT